MRDIQQARDNHHSPYLQTRKPPYSFFICFHGHPTEKSTRPVSAGRSKKPGFLSFCGTFWSDNIFDDSINLSNKSHRYIHQFYSTLQISNKFYSNPLLSFKESLDAVDSRGCIMQRYWRDYLGPPYRVVRKFMLLSKRCHFKI